MADTAGSDKSGNTGDKKTNALTGALSGAGNIVSGAGQRARRDLGSLLGRWRPNRPQQLVLAGILVIAFLELRVPSKFGDIWTLAFRGHLGSESSGRQSEPPRGGPAGTMTGTTRSAS